MFNIDIQYTWLLLFLPLVVAAFDWFLLTKRPDVAALTSTFSCLATFVLSLGLLDRTGSDSFSWLPISDIFSVDLGFVLDPLSSRMMLVVTGIGMLVHVFLSGLHGGRQGQNTLLRMPEPFHVLHDGHRPGEQHRHDLYLLGIGGPLLLSAYRPLVHTGHCRQRRQKAFICNRVGDFGFLIGILTLWALTNTLDFSLMEIYPQESVKTC